MIKQTIHCAGAPTDAFSVFVDSRKFEAMTGMAAKLSGAVGGRSTMFDGMIAAVNVEMIDGQRVVQAWRPGNWEEGVYSIVRFDFAADECGTKITLTHTGYPDGTEEHLEQGWTERYWAPLRAYLR